MSKYLCLQRGLPSGVDEPASPEKPEEMYAQFDIWQKKFGENIVDMGGKFGSGRIEGAKGTIADSLVKVHELAGGYMIVTAENMDGAITVVQECPGLLSPGSACEIIEISTP